MNKFDYVTVLCASPKNEQGRFEELGLSGLYVGGQVRMQAAADLYHDRDIGLGKLIVVGGGVESSDETEKWRKVSDMRDFLIEHSVPRDEIICIASQADTHGNFRALWKTCRIPLAGKRVGVLTNAYHLPRAIGIATDAQFEWDNTELILIAAEDVVRTMPPTYADYPSAYEQRLAQEAKGIKDWEEGVYRDQHLPSTEWKGELL